MPSARATARGGRNALAAAVAAESDATRILHAAEALVGCSATELDNDGSRGVRSLTHAAKFGFTYDRDRNHIADRRGQPLAGVLADLERTIAEQRTVVNERTRTLMDTLVMGELARHLQGQVHGLKGMIRPLMFDEAFYGIDAGRRDQLLRLATDLGLQLVIKTIAITREGAGSVDRRR